MGLVDTWMFENHIQQKRKQEFQALIKKGKPVHLRQLKNKGLMLTSENKIPTEMRSEEQRARVFDENESTISSHSIPALTKIAHNTKALSGKPSMF